MLLDGRLGSGVSSGGKKGQRGNGISLLPCCETSEVLL